MEAQDLFLPQLWPSSEQSFYQLAFLFISLRWPVKGRSWSTIRIRILKECVKLTDERTEFLTTIHQNKRDGRPRRWLEQSRCRIERRDIGRANSLPGQFLSRRRGLHPSCNASSKEYAISSVPTDRSNSPISLSIGLGVGENKGILISLSFGSIYMTWF